MQKSNFYGGDILELNKRKYRNKEVEEIIDTIEKKYEIELSSKQTTINELAEINKNLLQELNVLKERENLALETLKNAQQKADEIKEKSELSYELAIRKLDMFVKRWEEYFNRLSEKYPYYPEVQNAVELKDKVAMLIRGKEDSSIEKADALLKEKEDLKKDQTSFDPKSKIQDYITATTNDGFNLDDVLNPGALKLEDLCKELGLTEEEQ